MDALMGIVGAVAISRWSYGLMKESSDVLLDKSVGTSSFDKIVEAIKLENDAVISDIHIWKIAATHQAAILTVESKDPLEPHKYKQILKQNIPHLSHVSIEVNRI